MKGHARDSCAVLVAAVVDAFGRCGLARSLRETASRERASDRKGSWRKEVQTANAGNEANGNGKYNEGEPKNWRELASLCLCSYD